MAIELGRIKTKDLPENDYKILGISTRRLSESNGIFAVNFTTIDQVKDNLYNLIMTKKGERLMQPEFGCDLWKVVFQPLVDSEIEGIVESAIISAAERWLPEIDIREIVIDTSDDLKEINSFGVEIAFSLKINPAIGGEIQINIKQ